MKEKKKNYKLRAYNIRLLGFILIGLCILGGVGVYELVIKPETQTITELENAWGMLKENIFVEQEGMKLNFFIAGPALVGIIIWLIIILKKNKKFFNDKISLGLLIMIIIFYTIYSLIGWIMSSLIGAFVGVVIMEFVLEPMAKRNMLYASEDKEIRLEMKKERARRKVRDEIDGTV